jgi:hypothetical protein
MKQVHNRLLWAARRNAQYTGHQFVDVAVCAALAVIAGVLLALSI